MSAGASTSEPVRRRRARRAERTTDVTRFRGIVVAAVVGAAVVVGATIVLATGDGLPGPVARPHVVHGVACASCHDSPTFAAACTSCHGERSSTRDGHRKLAVKGVLGCVDCHAGHGGGGVTIEADGRALRYGGDAFEPAGTTRFRPRAALSIPVVTTATCKRCHDLASPRDPASACLVAGQDALGDARPTVCFDEHRRVRDAAGVIAPRAAAWDAARDVVASIPQAPAPPAPSPIGPWPWLGLGVLAAALAWITARIVDRRATTVDTAASAVAAPVALKRLPVIDTATCLGCYACVDACPYDVLEIQRYVAFVARPADCCGLILCEQKCPNGSLAIAFEDAAQSIPLADTFESREVPGVYLAGDVGGQPLIRNAINQGARAVRAIAEALPEHAAELDLVIIGAGPAGLAAALEATARNLRYVALEQATIADSIRSFPRGKLVIDPDLPNTSALWLAEATKEELLARWTRTVRETKPAILEGRRVTRITRGEVFTIDDVDRDGTTTSRTAARVLIAIGRRGTPRRLAAEIPAELADHVHYSLADARSFAARRVLVVGLGDVAMEAAVALSRQAGTEVVVAARAADFQRGKARNIAEIRRRVAAGNLRVIWQSEVQRLGRRVTLSTPSGPVDVECDSVFVLVGSIPAEGLLRGVGLLSETSGSTDR